ncbi:hypothetical protein RYH73_14150 [Olivibacter sp. CPCC 100613]|uniref:hypothetical protein n=1 Tax=Olivibacter sp. CPCC 100613 TaxID=3079931 RepID=UPI002FF900CD
MKKMILTGLLFASTGTMAFAQQNSHKKVFKTAEERAKRQTELLTQKLSLSEAQQKEIYAINLDNIKKIDTERKQQMQLHRELMQKSVKERDEKISELLTDVQRSNYQDLKKEKFQEKKHRGRFRSNRRVIEETPQS